MKTTVIILSLCLGLTISSTAQSEKLGTMDSFFEIMKKENWNSVSENLNKIPNGNKVYTMTFFSDSAYCNVTWLHIKNDQEEVRISFFLEKIENPVKVKRYSFKLPAFDKTPEGLEPTNFLQRKFLVDGKEYCFK